MLLSGNPCMKVVFLGKCMNVGRREISSTRNKQDIGLAMHKMTHYTVDSLIEFSMAGSKIIEFSMGQLTVGERDRKRNFLV